MVSNYNHNFVWDVIIEIDTNIEFTVVCLPDDPESSLLPQI